MQEITIPHIMYIYFKIEKKIAQKGGIINLVKRKLVNPDLYYTMWKFAINLQIKV